MPAVGSVPQSRLPSPLEADAPAQEPAGHRRRRPPDLTGVVLVLLAVELLSIVVTVAFGVTLDLRSGTFLAALILLTATVDGAVGCLWNRWRPPFSVFARVAGLLLVSALGAALVLDVVNRQEGFFASFSDLMGSPQRTSTTALPPARGSARLDILTPDWRSRGVAAAAAGHGVVLDARYWGGRSGITRRGYVYLPAAYFTDSAAVRFPVVELLHGQPGGPPNVIHQLGAPAIFDEEIAAGRMPPVIAVIPATWTRSFTECVNAVHGEADETYLTVDVPNDVRATLRALPGRAWAVAGYSTGGFCAANLALHHPDLYSAAASLSGYFTAAEDPHTSRLYRQSKTALRRNSPLWWVSHRTPVAPALYLFASRQDRPALVELLRFRNALSRYDPLLPTASLILPSGGHNWNVWRAGLGPALDWLAGYLPMPLVQP